ncbi:hypothetical protein, partial [Methylicorpusculum sp.]|uniref:hypothetical protein n=1 Tax=Methylicorpusculum sp. TaxID=2713644 RepID=UPI002ABC4FA0
YFASVFYPSDKTSNDVSSWLPANVLYFLQLVSMIFLENIGLFPYLLYYVLHVIKLPSNRHHC